MTREEAIKVLNKLKYPYNCKARKLIISNVERENEALEMAIKALSQEPSDAISREAVKELIKCGVSTDTYDDVEQVCKWIDALPPITQKSGKWIDDEFGSKCSCCGIHTHLDKFDRPMKFKYCSMCGAKMESEVRNDRKEDYMR